ncbi:putative spermidine/putrescine transport system permease protein [Bradyrhizobium brasilense]|uniref:Putative spermidine/putrescine transport system permease protein n=1 Tax=Bradyrhizobium brasilense TaxID=1419277 RepID=A0A1G6U320_9BRAD|nr:ABC transporter permease [Bradyrhizobium brasilense]SDD35604.1 putative spermidine/putrescine transport system permease protein [Bradyrhizobium brasilense]
MSPIIYDPQSHRYRTLGNGLATAIYMFLLAPLLVAIPMAFGPTTSLAFPPTDYSLDLFRIFLTSPSWLGPLSESLKVALASMAIAIIAGVPAGYWIARHEFMGKSLISGVILSPLIVPHIVIGLGLFLYFSYVRISGTTLSIVLGHVMATLPFVVLMIVAGVNKLDRNLEFGAELMGAGPIRMFLTVVIPQLIPSLVAAAFLAFLMSFDEVVISWFLAGPNTITLPIKMYNELQWELSPVLAAISAMLTAISLLVSIVAVALRKGTSVDI